MIKPQCKAKNPSECRFHGRSRYKEQLEAVDIWEKELAVAKSFDDYERAQKNLAHYRLTADATAQGFKKLSRELARSISRGSVEEQAELSERIRKASELRLRDGHVNEWFREDAYTHFGFTNLILEKAKTEDTVLLPVQRTGSQDMMTLASRLHEEKLELVSVESFALRRKRDSTEVEQMEASLDTLVAWKTGNFEEWLSKSFDAHNIIIRGLQFKNFDGRLITVKGSHELTDKIRDLTD
jgi:hypothetical protein